VKKHGAAQRKDERNFNKTSDDRKIN